MKMVNDFSKKRVYATINFVIKIILKKHKGAEESDGRGHISINGKNLYIKFIDHFSYQKVLRMFT